MFDLDEEAEPGRAREHGAREAHRLGMGAPHPGQRGVACLVRGIRAEGAPPVAPTGNDDRVGGPGCAGDGNNWRRGGRRRSARARKASHGGEEEPQHEPSLSRFRTERR